MNLHGIDFSSAPNRRKPIVVASGRIATATGKGREAVEVSGIEALESLQAFDDWLRRPGPWLGAFDFPFGLPRELLEAFGWLSEAGPWAASIGQVAALGRAEFVERLRAFCAARPVGAKFAHRAADLPAGSSPSMKWVNPPVALMLHAGAPRLLRAGMTIPGLHAGDPSRIGLEAYPGFLARAIAGRVSYKSDERSRQTPERRAARVRILEALEAGAHRLGIAVRLQPALALQCVEDPAGDRLDAVLCLVQAAWAWQRRDSGFGLPAAIDPVEGWIVAVPKDGCAG